MKKDEKEILDSSDNKNILLNWEKNKHHENRLNSYLLERDRLFTLISSIGVGFLIIGSIDKSIISLSVLELKLLLALFMFSIMINLIHAFSHIRSGILHHEKELGLVSSKSINKDYHFAFLLGILPIVYIFSKLITNLLD